MDSFHKVLQQDQALKLARELDNLLDTKVCPIHIMESELDRFGMKGVTKWDDITEMMRSYLERYNTKEAEFTVRMEIQGVKDATFIRHIVIDVKPVDERSAAAQLKKKMKRAELSM
jgi:hypothetical protein